MIERTVAEVRHSRPTPTLDAPTVRAWVDRLQAVDASGLDDAGRIDLLRALEELKCSAEGVQAVIAVELDASVREHEARCGVPRERRGRGVAGQVALARRESSTKGRQHLGLAKVLTTELPHTFAALRAGRITQWRATIVARETACLSREHRLAVDEQLAARDERLEAMGEGELVASAQRIAYRLDAEAAVRRRRRAESERRVSLRPAPDVMSHLSALLPVKEGVAVYAALDRQAKALVAAGDGRGRGQIMADTLVQRVLQVAPATDAHAGGESVATGQSEPADDAAPSGGARDSGGVPVMIHLVVSDEVLLGGANGAGHVDGYGPVPADLARELVGEQAFVRRLYASPSSGALVAADARARRFPPGLARLVRLRDRSCRTPWCDAPIRHVDHVVAVGDGGETTLSNAQGLCEACNYAKQALAWSARPRPAPAELRHTVQTTTPTGHRYASTAPSLGDPRPPESTSEPSGHVYRSRAQPVFDLRSPVGAVVRDRGGRWVLAS